MKRIVILFGVLILMVTSGCAFTNQNIELEHKAKPKISSKDKGDLYFSKLRDDRIEKNRVGVVKNGFGAETADVATKQDVTIWISKAIISEMESIGYTVTKVDIDKSDVNSETFRNSLLVTGGVKKVFAEPIVGLWAGDVTGNIQVTLELYKNGDILTKNYAANEKVTTMVWTAKYFKDSLEKTLESLLIQVRNDFQKLI